MKIKNSAQKQGFTLVELSIVLVILGLLVGGVLTGQSLIRASELRSVVTEYQSYRTATHAFRDKYFSLPGDMTNATAFWGKDNAACTGHTGATATPGTCNGNGDGQLSQPSGANATGESVRYWQHLALAGLVSGTYTGNASSGHAQDTTAGQNVPRSKLSNAGWGTYHYGTFGVDNTGWGNFEGVYNTVYLYGVKYYSGLYEGEVLKPEEAWNIDTKMDDGRPGLGIMRVYETNSNCHDAGGWSATLPLASTANYKLNSTSVACMLILNMT